MAVRTRHDQALLYRLTGDRNPLHSDPAFARRAGFDRPILHGMCTYGFTARALIAAVGHGDPDRLVAMHARFTRPVLPGGHPRGRHLARQRRSALPHHPAPSSVFP